MNDLAMVTYVDMQQSPETKRAYARDLRVYTKFIEDLGTIPEEMTESDAVTFRDFLVESFAPNGAARVWNTVRGMYKFAGIPSPFERVKPPKRATNVLPKVPSDEDVALLMAAAVTVPSRAAIIALLLNGLRASEVASLMRDDIEIQQDAFVMRVLGKGMKERMVPLTSEALMAVEAYQARANERQKYSDYVVSDYNGNGLTLRQVEEAVYRAARDAKVEGMHPHALRHHYATRLIRAGVETVHVMRLLGHASVATTQVYVGLNLGDLIAASKKDPRNA